ncbi:MAG: DMT family transporter [Anaerolineae bacterium]|jgi:drug/metabolite transporter (DMT)-like permease|nr:DMT family transporter [Anaerolineae bacterium]
MRNADEGVGMGAKQRTFDFLRGAQRSGEQDIVEARRRKVGFYSGIVASFLLGWAPILGKLAYQFGVTPLTLAASRTVVAVLFLFVVYLLFWRRLLILRVSDLFNCLLVGMINGVGSIFYYSALDRMDASRASLLSALYAIWVVIFLAASGQPLSRLTLSRLATSLVGAVLVTSPWVAADSFDLFGVMLMAASAALNGWYMVMGQWVLADVPARSATLYILTGMAITVSVARVVSGSPVEPLILPGWAMILALGLTTAISRMAVFFSLERLGGVQTVLLSFMEMAVSLALAMVLLGERLSWVQWVGAVLLLGGGFLARQDLERGGAPPPAFNPMDV